MRFLVSSVRHRGRNQQCRLAGVKDSGLVLLECTSEIVLKQGEVIATEDESIIKTALILEGEEREVFMDELNMSIGKRVNALLSNEEYKRGNAKIDEATKRMWGSITSAAGLFLRKLLLGIPIMVRFHNDADGSSGAYALYRAANTVTESANMIWMMNKGAIYSAEDAQNDTLMMNSYSNVERPLLVIIDFGTAKESNKGIESVQDSFDILWLDHHPIQPGFLGVSLQHYINPWSFGSDSNYTAGLLSAVFTHAFSKADTREIEEASLTGDYSSFRSGKEGVDLATILDLLTSDSKIVSGYAMKGITPKEIDSVLSDSAKRTELLNYANIRMQEALDNALKAVKSYGDGMKVYVLDFEGIRTEDTKYPLPGRFSTRLLDNLSAGSENCAVVVHAGLYISMRLSKTACAGKDLNLVIKALQEKMPHRIENGGGHSCAASMKVFDKSDKKDVIKELVEVLKG